MVTGFALATLLADAALAVPPATCNGLAVNLAGATDGDDDILGTAGDDVIHLGDGDDTFDDNLGGNDTVCGGEGDDDISGGTGKDGKGGDDTMDGGANNAMGDECVRDQPGDTLISCETETAGAPSGTIVIVKDTVPTDPRDFDFNGSGVLGSFMVSDGNPATFANIAVGQYTVTEVVQFDWPLTAISCDDANSTVNIPLATATIELEASEIVTCTFTNSLSDVIFKDSFEDP